MKKKFQDYFNPREICRKKFVESHVGYFKENISFIIDYFNLGIKAPVVDCKIQDMERNQRWSVLIAQNGLVIY